MADKEKPTTGREVAVRDGEFAVALAEPKEVAEILIANVGVGGLKPASLDRIKFPAGGGLAWTLPGLEGEEVVKDWTGIILHWNPARKYWKGEFSGGGHPPDCKSLDGVRGIGDPGGICEKCPLSRFDYPNKGDAPACKEVRVWFVLRPGERIPVVVSIPPGSLKEVSHMFLRTGSKGLFFWQVVFKFSLQKQKNPAGQEYSGLHLGVARKLEPDEIAAVQVLRTALAPLFGKIEADAEAFGG